MHRPSSRQLAASASHPTFRFVWLPRGPLSRDILCGFILRSYTKRAPPSCSAHSSARAACVASVALHGGLLCTVKAEMGCWKARRRRSVKRAETAETPIASRFVGVWIRVDWRVAFIGSLLSRTAKVQGMQEH